MDIRARYKASKSAKVGDTCICPSCGTEFIKENYQQAFCKTKSKTICKDKYWNTVTPNKRNNKTRISPANRRWKQHQEEVRDARSVYDDYHPFEGLNDDDYKNH